MKSDVVIVHSTYTAPQGPARATPTGTATPPHGARIGAHPVGDRLGKLYLTVRHHHGYKRGMADAGTSRVRGRRLVLRLLSFTFRQAP